MQPIRIIDTDFNLLAEIDNYESLVWTHRWHKPGEFELHINANKQSTECLQKGRLVLAGSKAGIILHRELVQGVRGKGEEQVVAKGMSLAAIVGRRITIPPAGYAYDRVSAAAETIMKGYVSRNCITPADPKRAIPNLVIATDQGRGAHITYQTRLKQLDEELEKLSLVSGLGWDVVLDWQNKQWVFDVLTGRDLTAGQTINPPVIFSADFDAVKAQTFIESDIGHRNQAYVGGQGEGAERDIVEVGSDFSGLERLETFVDARDLEQAADLPERGLQKLAEVVPVLTFDTEILTEGPYKYGTDWDLGDVVTVQNRKWGVTLDSRITEVTEVYEPAGFQLRATFGSSIPTLPDRIKQELDAPLVEKGVLEKGDPGEPGTDGADGVGLSFLWDGTSLGVKREDEAQYTYVDLEGPQGIQGPKGEKGETGPQGLPGVDGKSLEFLWDGTRLGVRLEGEATYQYVDLKGDKGDKGDKGEKGDKGDKGDPGSDANVTYENVTNALGYTPVNKVGDTMEGNLGVNGRLIIQGGMTFQAYGQNIDFNAATLNNITSLSTRGATPSFIMGIDYNGYPVTLNHGFVVNVKNATSGRGLASNKAYHVVDIQDPANPILKFGVSSVGVVEAETYKTLDGIEVSYEGHTHQVSDIEGLENVGSGGTTIITSATEPEGLVAGDQWHREI